MQSKLLQMATYTRYVLRAQPAHPHTLMPALVEQAACTTL